MRGSRRIGLVRVPIFSDLVHCAAPTGTVQAFRFYHLFDARQMLGQAAKLPIDGSALFR